jgi:hypothetical protein
MLHAINKIVQVPRSDNYALEDYAKYLRETIMTLLTV